MCVSMAVILPVSLDAQETAAAMLHSSGSGVLVNKYPVPDSIALFANDLVETPKNSVARIEVAGSSADINADTMLQFGSEELVLDHGSVSISTGRGLRVRVGCLTVTPVNASEWTQYSVSDVDGKVVVNASKSDVYIDARKKAQESKNPSRSSRDLVREGEQKSREEKCGAAYLKAETRPGIDALLNSTWAKMVAASAVGVVVCLGLCHDDDPVSPAKP